MIPLTLDFGTRTAQTEPWQEEDERILIIQNEKEAEEKKKNMKKTKQLREGKKARGGKKAKRKKGQGESGDGDDGGSEESGSQKPSKVLKNWQSNQKSRRVPAQ